jgi:uncharacterized membrane protein YagU involved in acid resistance
MARRFKQGPLAAWSKRAGMASLVSKPNWGRLIGQGILAGIVGAILIDAFQYFSTLATTHQASIVAIWQYVASSAVGATAYTSTSYAWLGLLFHAIVSIAWAIGYAYVAATRPNVMSTPWLSGLVFGAVVWLIMTFVLMLDRIAPPISATSVVMGLTACCIFYGIPVALTVRAVAQRA